jgi:hypothetical protein
MTGDELKSEAHLEFHAGFPHDAHASLLAIEWDQ